MANTDQYERAVDAVKKQFDGLIDKDDPLWDMLKKTHPRLLSDPSYKRKERG
jgi:hypothetical protein